MKLPKSSVSIPWATSALNIFYKLQMAVKASVPLASVAITPLLYQHKPTKTDLNKPITSLIYASMQKAGFLTLIRNPAFDYLYFLSAK